MDRLLAVCTPQSGHREGPREDLLNAKIQVDLRVATCTVDGAINALESKRRTFSGHLECQNNQQATRGRVEKERIF